MTETIRDLKRGDYIKMRVPAFPNEDASCGTNLVVEVSTDNLGGVVLDCHKGNRVEFELFPKRIVFERNLDLEGKDMCDATIYREKSKRVRQVTILRHEYPPSLCSGENV